MSFSRHLHCVWAVGLAALVALDPAAGAAQKPPAAAQKARPTGDTTTENGPRPKFSPAGGVFSKAFSVQLTGDDPALAIRYTLDGSDPTDRADAVRGEMRLSATTLVKARLFRDKLPAGPTVSQTYIVIEPELESFHSHLPVIILNSFGREILHSEKLIGSVRMIAPRNGSTTLVGAADFDGRGDLHLRGNTSLRYLKRSYGLKLRDDNGQAYSAPVLGFPKDSDWVLYAPYPDKTLLRDVLAYDLSRQLGQYASRARFVEVFVNQIGGKLSMRHYTGVFVLEEKVKRGKERVAIEKLTPEDNTEPAITGGYLFKKDHLDGGGEAVPSVEGRPNWMGGGGGSSRYGYPTGPGGFPGDPAGFQSPVGGARRTDRNPGGGGAFSPESTTLFDRFRMAMPPDENLPGPPQPGRPAPRVRNGEPPQFQTENPGNGMNRQFAFNRFNGSSTEEYFRTRQHNEFIYVDPKPEEITPAQKNWLRNHLNEFESVLYGPGFRDPAKGYAAYIDPLSFIDHHLMVEVTKNIDGFRFSTFYSKDRGGKIQMQPIWDWNLSFGNANGKQGWMAEFWYWPQLDDNQYTWFRRLFEDPEFGQRYVDRWGELRTTVFSLTNLMVRIDGLVADLGEARVRNFKRWPILNRKIWPNTFQGETYEDEIRFLKDFTRKRLAWIDAQFVAAPVATREGARLVKLSAARGKIYFTTDGSDPRAVGGSPGPGARPYTEPVQLPASSSQVAGAPAPARLVARALFENRWSPPTRL